MTLLGCSTNSVKATQQRNSAYHPRACGVRIGPTRWIPLEGSSAYSLPSKGDRALPSRLTTQPDHRDCSRLSLLRERPRFTSPHQTSMNHDGRPLPHHQYTQHCLHLDPRLETQVGHPNTGSVRIALPTRFRMSYSDPHSRSGTTLILLLNQPT